MLHLLSGVLGWTCVPCVGSRSLKQLHFLLAFLATVQVLEGTGSRPWSLVWSPHTWKHHVHFSYSHRRQELVAFIFVGLFPQQERGGR